MKNLILSTAVLASLLINVNTYSTDECDTKTVPEAAYSKLIREQENVAREQKQKRCNTLIRILDKDDNFNHNNHTRYVGADFTYQKVKKQHHRAVFIDTELNQCIKNDKTVYYQDRLKIYIEYLESELKTLALQAEKEKEEAALEKEISNA